MLQPSSSLGTCMRPKEPVFQWWLFPKYSTWEDCLQEDLLFASHSIILIGDSVYYGALDKEIGVWISDWPFLFHLWEPVQPSHRFPPYVHILWVRDELTALQSWLIEHYCAVGLKVWALWLLWCIEIWFGSPKFAFSEYCWPWVHLDRW